MLNMSSLLRKHYVMYTVTMETKCCARCSHKVKWLLRQATKVIWSYRRSSQAGGVTVQLLRSPQFCSTLGLTSALSPPEYKVCRGSTEPWDEREQIKCWGVEVPVRGNKFRPTLTTNPAFEFPVNPAFKYFTWAPSGFKENLEPSAEYR